MTSNIAAVELALAMHTSTRRLGFGAMQVERRLPVIPGIDLDPRFDHVRHPIGRRDLLVSCCNRSAS